MTKLKKRNKFSFLKGHIPFNKGQANSHKTKSVKILRTGTYRDQAKSRKSTFGRRKTGRIDDTHPCDYSLRKRGICQNQEKNNTNPEKTKK